MKASELSDLFICATCHEHARESEEWFILPDGVTVCSPQCGRKHLENKSCKRPSGSPRAVFSNRESAVAFAQDPTNPNYHGNIAHLCVWCGL
jgi:hypothetical protein